MFYIWFICVCFIAHADQPTSTLVLPADKLFHFYITINNIPNQTMESHIQVPVAVTVQQKTLTHFFNQLSDVARHYSKASYDSLLSFFYNNPIKITAASIFSSWLSTASYCLYAEYCLCKYVHWADWKSELDNRILHEIPLENLQKDLLCAIQEYYQFKNNLNDFFSPLISFFNDAQTETILLQRFLFIRAWIAKLHLTKLYPNQDQAIEKAELCLDRIAFFKNLISSWLIHYKIENHLITHA